ncbi:MAG: DUF6596 domain-containing protein, partial [Pseudomonadota bacterium]
MSAETAARAADVARASYGKLVAIIARRSGDIIAAEDALADAFVKALDRWPSTGIPDRPEAWLLTVARNQMTDQMRRDKRLDFTAEVPEMPDTATAEQIPDERLKLMFVCAHPAIDPKIHAPLMLQTVLGLEAEQIARAFLVSPTAMAQRLVRAKQKIKRARVPFVQPDSDALPARMGAVLEAVYAAYALDWMGGSGELAHEARFLSAILADLTPDCAEALGLSALIGFVHARHGARIRDGVLVPLPDQEMHLWDEALMAGAEAMLNQAATLGRLGRFQLEAAIQSVHAARRRGGATDWRALSQLYVGLNSLYPTVGGRVSQAAVVGEDAGPEEGLRMLDRLSPQDAEGFQPAWAVRAALLRRLKRHAEANVAYT